MKIQRFKAPQYSRFANKTVHGIYATVPRNSSTEVLCCLVIYILTYILHTKDTERYPLHTFSVQNYTPGCISCIHKVYKVQVKDLFRLVYASSAWSLVLDFNNPVDTKLFKAATEKLPIEFDCNSDNSEYLPLFLAQLQDWAADYDWLALLLITKDGNEEMTKDLIESYGKLSYKDVKQHRRQATFQDLCQLKDQIRSRFGDVVPLHHGVAHWGWSEEG
jgi:hypothetical protein